MVRKKSGDRQNWDEQLITSKQKLINKKVQTPMLIKKIVENRWNDLKYRRYIIPSQVKQYSPVIIALLKCAFWLVVVDYVGEFFFLTVILDVLLSAYGKVTLNTSNL